MLELEMKFFYDLTNESIESKFNESINNANIPMPMTAGIHTQDTLKPSWSEACSSMSFLPEASNSFTFSINWLPCPVTALNLSLAARPVLDRLGSLKEL